MVKLDVTLLRYLSRDDFRVLTSVEMGMRNHELVPRSLIYSISGINNGSISKILLNLTQNKFLSYERGKRFDGYRLTYRGYDYLALNVLRTRGVISSIGNQIGVGKESDVYVASNDEGRQFAIKFHRLGRTCFRKVSEKRDYQKRSQNHKTASWIYLSRLAALKEFAFMKLLYNRRLLPIPEPVDYNRHCIVMELIDGTILNHVKEIEEKPAIETLYEKLMNMIMQLSNEFGVVHGDFNEFNILIKHDGSYDPVMIDFPQMISINHELAQEYFERDVNCVVDFFVKRFAYESDSIPCFEQVQEEQKSDLQNLAVAMDDEETFLSHLERRNVDSSINADGGSKFSPNEILSKFLNSLPNVVNSNEGEMAGCIDSIDEKLAQEAEEKILLEKQKMENNLNQCQVLVEESDVNTEDKDDQKSVQSYAYSTASTFSPLEVKSRLIREKKKRELREKMRVNPKNVKGDANAIHRRKKNDQALANEDLKAYTSGSIW